MNDVPLSLIDPTEKTESRVAGKERTLNAYFSAPLANYPQHYERSEGLLGVRMQQNMDITGLHMLQPYDPDRVPLFLSMA